MKKIREKTIRQEIFQLLIMTSIIPILVMGVVNFYSLNKKINKNVDITIESSVDIIKEELGNSNANSYRDIEYLSMDPNAKGIKENKNNEALWFEKTLQSYFEKKTDIMNLSIASENGK